MGSSSRTTTPSQLKTGHEEVREEAGHGIYHVQNQAEQNERKFKFFMFCVNHCSQRCFADSLLQVESGNASHPGASRRAVRPRLAFMMDEDDWPLFSNPECTHQRHCGHAARPRVLFKPDGIEPAEKVHALRTGPPGTRPLFSTSTSSQTSRPSSLHSQEEEDMGDENTVFPSKVGPFLLESLSGGASVVEGREYSVLCLRPIWTIPFLSILPFIVLHNGS